MATVHLIHGYLGAGKSRFARDLAARRAAVLISLDEWYLRLYTDGEPTPHMNYGLLRRLTAVLNDHWPRIVRGGGDVVLDFGFWSRADRDRAREIATAVPVDHRLYWVRTDDATAVARCAARNERPGASFVIDPAAYRDLRSRYEEPSEDEEFEVITT